MSLSMPSVRSLALLLAFSCSGATGFAAAAPQDERAAPAAGETAWIEQIEASLKDARSVKAEVREAAAGKLVEAIDQLTASYAALPADRQKPVVAAITKIFSVRTPDEENRIYIAAAAALSEMGEAGEAGLLKAMKVSHLEKRIEVQATLLEALGRHCNEKHVDLFVKTLLKAETQLVVAAIKSLGEYRESDGKVRKRIAEALVKEYARTNSAEVAAKGKDEVARQRLLDLEVPMNVALEMVTLQRFESAPEWEKWFNDNRNKNW
jgi:hypothetical protein